ncbi:monovalent cation/H(+) antiporter subunit G [Rhodococcus sp. BGS-1C]|jgi:multicomponent Na+:H+ antiporter subunit G|uniref:monovalent cation/H(+) antiporter subunit G n=1 Tax=Nocardiaceae TaxID=85025 RepID=UPI00095D51A5|nr:MULTISPECIES: monovalent cation/H(+) antiporter subunit G [Rhodococcus]MCC8926536.1 monovalent cation/H(+) antiporter subunit G [Rhodococcus sp. I2R]MCZ4276547.1 monovalent cation/H(+) antiporter subunit G [Rhodococcus yunnanensis]OLT35816.1 Na+/H+ antiporter subunit G [Rhodococcus sp. CUA-806]
MNTVLDVISGTFILLGAVFAFTAAVGVVRFADTLSRMHAATKPQVVGLVLVLTGAVIQLRGNVDIWMLVLVGIFTLTTAPIIAHNVGRTAYREQRGRDGLRIVNEPEN